MKFESSLDRLLKFPNPYPGLRPFESDEGFLFFGRDDQTAALVNRIGRHRFLALVGVSGSGKSSLVLAGLIPALRRGVVPGSASTWREVVIRPGAAPIDNLASALVEAGFRVDNLRRSSYGIVNTAAQLRADENLLLIVDQFEELFRYKDESLITPESAARRSDASVEASEFVQLLLTATRERPPIYVVITMRSEYLGDCAEFRGFADMLNATQYLIPRLTRDQRQAAIEGPLGRLPIDPNLVQRILNEAGDEPSDLPLLQHALMRTWSRWQAAGADRTAGILEQHYEAAGGLANALNLHADELLQSPVARAKPAVPEQIFRRLTARGRSLRERRDPTRLQDLWAVCGAESSEQRQAVNDVIDLFRMGEATFLTPRRDDLTPDRYIDITHESLIKKWSRLATEWFPAEQKQAAQLREFHARAVRWKDGGAVLYDRDLREAETWDRTRNRQAAWAQHHLGGADPAVIDELLDASRKERAKLEKQESFRRSLLGYALLVSLIVAGLVGWLAVRARDDARSSRASRLAAQADQMRNREPNRLDLSLLIAVASMKLSPSAQADQLIREIGGLLGTPVARLDHASKAPVWAVAIGGKRAATLPEGTELYLWELETGKKLGTIDAGARINAFAFSPDANHVAVAAANGLVIISNIEGAAPVERRRLLHRESVNGVAFSTDTGAVATAGDDGLVRVWDMDAGPAQTSEPTETFSHLASVKLVAFGQSGVLASAGDDGPIRVWQTGRRGGSPQSREVATVANSEPLASLVVFDNKAAAGLMELESPLPEPLKPVLAAADYGSRLRLWVLSFNESRSRRASMPLSIDCSPEHATYLRSLWNRSGTRFGPQQRRGRSHAVVGCNHLAVLHDDGVTSLWDPDEDVDGVSSEETRFIQEGSALAASMNDGYVVVGDSTGTARVWRFLPDAPAAGAARNSWNAVSPDGRRTAILTPEQHSWHDLASGTTSTLAPPAGSAGAASSAAFDPSGERLAIGYAQELRIWTLSNNSFVAAKVLSPRVVQFEQDAVLVDSASGFSTWNARTGELLWRVDASIGDRWDGGPVLSPNGRTAVTWESDGAPTLWSGADSRTMLPASRDVQVRTAAFDRRSGQLAICPAKDKRLLLLEPSKGTLMKAIPLDAPCRAIASDAASGRLAVALDGAVHLVNGDSASVLSHLEDASDLRFSPDGRLLAVANVARERIDVIDVASGETRVRIPLTRYRSRVAQYVWSLEAPVFSMDSSQLIAPGWTYSVSPGLVTGDACRRLRQGALDTQVATLLGTDAWTVVECLAAATVR